MALRYSAVLSMAAVTFALSASSGVIAGPMNLAPPVGAILDLDGQAIPSSPQTYTVDFTATQSSTAITFALREDPAYLSLSNIFAADVASSTNLIVNPNFSQGPVGASAPTGWTYANIYGATFGGVTAGASTCTGFSSCYYDGAVQAYDAISQTVATTIGDVYQITFQLADNSGETIFHRQSTNGDVTDTGGNGIDLLVYAQAGLPMASAVPEPSTWAMIILGFCGVGFLAHRRKRSSLSFSAT